MPKHQTDTPPERTPLQPGDLRRMASDAELGLVVDFLAAEIRGNRNAPVEAADRNAGTLALIEGVETGAIDTDAIRRMAAQQREVNAAADAALMAELMGEVKA